MSTVLYMSMNSLNQTETSVWKKTNLIWSPEKIIFSDKMLAYQITCEVSRCYFCKRDIVLQFFSLAVAKLIEPDSDGSYHIRYNHSKNSFIAI